MSLEVPVRLVAATDAAAEAAQILYAAALEGLAG
ncbi:hypothetical protein FHS12_000046 [Nocardioides albus]|uniref:Uncharacterized protein n=1 Tax=Nocardioides albus TaxID=1841 RepID=A0A7W5A072_9ACTN|nr:hypothetical protein [Nocardioides albus]